MGTRDSALRVRICARGLLEDAAREELAGFVVETCDVSHVALHGTVPDQPALLGVLELLRRSGLRIRDVETVPGRPEATTARPGAAVARVQIRGRVGDLLALVLDPVLIAETSATTTVEVDLRDDHDAVFELLGRLERLALEVVEVHIHPERP